MLTAMLQSRQKGSGNMMDLDELYELFLNADEDVKASVEKILIESQLQLEHPEEHSCRDQ